jgi:hypothetical protein
MRTSITAAFLALALSACTAKENAPAADSGAVAATPADSDPDVNVAGGTIPAGYSARTDRADAEITGASYTASGSGWEVRTGPAHVIYAARDTASGNYTVSATVEQLEKPTHPEAYGLFIGGRDLEGPSQTYTYFVVRGTGELLVKVREGGQTRDVLKWTANADVPKEDASGKGTYALSASVTNDAVKFSVNGKQVASVSKAGLPVDGIAGLRINHNLHLRVTPVSIQKP